MRKEKNNKMTPNLKFLENQTQIFRNLNENTKKTPNLEFLKIKKELGTCKFEKLKENKSMQLTPNLKYETRLTKRL